jgi:hypothetical protein
MAADLKLPGDLDFGVFGGTQQRRAFFRSPSFNAWQGAEKREI